MKNDDRRESKRISYLCEVECEGFGVGRLATRINDLSITGAFIDSMTCYAPGTTLRLTFHIKDVQITTTAEVRYTMPQTGMGVRFLSLTAPAQAALESLIEGKPLSITVADSQRDSAPDSNTPDLLLGNFAIVSMFDVIQIIENNRLTGVLVVNSPAVQGEIQFNGGQIVGAQSGLKTGIAGLKSFMDVTEGTFEFKRSDVQHQPTISATNNRTLMLDLLKIKDEDEATRLSE
ncbi:MAG TPA: DUF4388 domain-containing protein [Blastocatellia bacterium]|nr:DUF4388 domain-containing protein [Blastocatellia bacterium]